MTKSLRQRFRDARRHAFSPGGLLLRAALIAAVFGVLHAFGQRDNMAVLCGTDASAGEAPRRTLQFAVLYLLGYLGAVVLAPIAALTAVFLKLLDRLDHSTPEPRS